MVKTKFKVKREFFDKKKYKVAGDLHKDLKNGLFSIKKVSNRDFWKKEIKGGFYKYILDEEYFYMEYYLKPKQEKINTDHFEKTILKCFPECEYLESVELSDEINPNELKFIKSGIMLIGEDYFNNKFNSNI
jgi:hypothetical protein